MITTPSDYSHNNAWLVTDAGFITFQVRACSEARILLAQDPFDVTSPNYEIVIGGSSNTKTSIVKDSTTLNEANTPGILSCDVPARFWIKWLPTSGIIVGDGILGSRELVRYDNTNMNPLYAVSISTGQGSTGEWQFESHSGKIDCYYFFIT